MSLEKCDIGVVGMAVMGQNLALNIESKGYKVAVYNRDHDKTKKFIEERASNKNILGTYTYEELAKSLNRPRKIMLMVKAGKPVDDVIEQLLPNLEKGDIIIDGGNSHYKDTNRRFKYLQDKGIRFLGTGISGGEYGALHGPSIMPGGDKSAYEEMKDIFEAIAAKTEDGPCVAYLGPSSSGHYVKMVHNGIEYAIMELISEAYDIMRKVFRLSADEMHEIFKKWNDEHKSYLMEITYKILEWKDEETGKPLVDVILDSAQQKGTGKWSVQDALDLNISIPTINAAVNARTLSAIKHERLEIGNIFDTPVNNSLNNDFINSVRDALYIATIIAYAEGMKLLQVASSEYGYGLDLSEVARIWEDGCIIRSALLKPIQKSFKSKPNLVNLIISEEFRKDFENRIPKLREVVSEIKKIGIPIPAFASALDYFDGLRSKELPANLIQAQRDFFGAHTYQRKDKEGIFHTEWQDIHNI
ncbi:NADP-dependent phosphogluconate dehydrogenase [Defluviitoga tunisiensis]|jgi:6-phosphogluconate dehydrogenase|uniref:6-phosphogluconate dehydrogenase, decarboxylating n=1 Tax=Defluviitoga tunisiensis TaxID=1006576 RepID=A0A0C7NYX0_DEFTU|nr:NADP-dependent phosphogluconate dehydrogenase [Defluviitoga tunisiensis]MDY0379724.1 NADP-dependent phosphogluconate dehydrogenase [Defluviitoga tunisiensis]CEP78468.1 6-phosphogluconate dehydrogenase [Defluviitoga tunisiensis]HHV00598.1 NADP-dependent phosphogluconate dehydrogenase [Defluviitoga tunisiensis]